MITKISVAGMAIHDFCQLDHTDPPLSIERDLGMLPVKNITSSYQNRSIDTTYWQFGAASMIRLAQSIDGRLIIGSNQTFPGYVKHVEYYKDQRLFSLVFDTEDEDSSLLPVKSPQYRRHSPQQPERHDHRHGRGGEEPYGYMVPLVQIGI